MRKAKSMSSLLDAVHETAQDLHPFGYIDRRKMVKYDALCLPPVKQYAAKEVRELRDHLHVSQADFASLLNTRVSTVRKWEIGDKRPCGPSQKLLDLMERKGAVL